MTRYAALLRGVSPMNVTMPDLKAAFETAGFTEVKTVLSSGNVVFSARRASEATLRRRAEGALRERLGRGFLTIVRPIDHLLAMLAADPYRRFRLPPSAKRIVTFLLDERPAAVALPIERHGARLLLHAGREVYGAYVPGPRGPEFMALIERTFGRDVTTRTWDSVGKVARAGGEQ